MIPQEIRKQILRLLQRDARMAHATIAERLAVPVERVTEAVKDMEQDGTIIGYYALVNDEQIDDDNAVRAMIEVEVQPERDGGFDHTAELISKFPEVQTLYLVSGRYDLRIEVVGSSLREVAMFVSSKLAPLDGIKSTVTHFLLKKYKEAGFRLGESETYERLKITP